jgi:hypothetical protein
MDISIMSTPAIEEATALITSASDIIHRLQDIVDSPTGFESVEKLGAIISEQDCASYIEGLRDSQRRLATTLNFLQMFVNPSFPNAIICTDTISSKRIYPAYSVMHRRSRNYPLFRSHERKFGRRSGTWLVLQD